MDREIPKHVDALMWVLQRPPGFRLAMDVGNAVEECASLTSSAVKPMLMPRRAHDHGGSGRIKRVCFVYIYIDVVVQSKMAAADWFLAYSSYFPNISIFRWLPGEVGKSWSPIFYAFLKKPMQGTGLDNLIVDKNSSGYWQNHLGQFFLTVTIYNI